MFDFRDRLRGCSALCFCFRCILDVLESVTACLQVQVGLISRTYFAHCYCGDCGPSCFVDGPGARSRGPNRALSRTELVCGNSSINIRKQLNI